MAIEITVPDIGDFKDIPIIEIHVKPGDAIKADDPLITLESDKATMDVPADQDGTVESLLVKLGDKVSQGSPIAKLKAANGEAAAPMTPPPAVVAQQEPPGEATAARPRHRRPRQHRHRHPPRQRAGGAAGVHASPSVRRLARELEVDLAQLKGTGEKGRITKEDVKAYPARSGTRPGPDTGTRPAAWASPRSRPRTSPSSARSRPSRSPGSSGSPGRTCTAPGSTSRTSPTATRATSPRSTPTGRSWTRPPRRRATG